MNSAESPSQKQAWANRFQALRPLPQVARLLWTAAPIAVASTILLRLLGGLIPLGMLYAGKRLIDLIAGASKGPAFSIDEVWLWVGVEFGLAVLTQLLTRGVDFADGYIADRFSHNLGLTIMSHAATLDLSSFEDPAFHDRLANARAQSTDRIGMLTSTGWLFQRFVMLLSLATGIIYYFPWLLLVLAVSVLPAFLVESHFAFLGYTLAHELTPTRRALEYYLGLGSSREAAKEVKVFSLAPHFERQYSDLSSGVIEKNRVLALRRLRWGSVFAIFATAGYYVGYLHLAQEAFQQRITMGAFTFMVGALAGTSGHLQTIFSLFSDIADQALFLGDLVTFLEERPKIVAPDAPLAVANPIQTGLEFENVSFTYPGSTRPVLENLSFKLARGQRMALVGGNGQGKTTLVKLLARLYDPTSGRILLDGSDLRNYDPNELRKEIGIIFQDFARYDLSARENIAAGNIASIDDDDALWAASRKSNAEELVRGFPSGLQQMLGRRFEGGVELSGGEWQRMALARAYLRDAQILILDEPTAALDPMAEFEVFQKFAELTEDKIAIFISHRFSTVRMADRIMVLADGHIVEDGSHDQLLSADGIYAKLFEVQAASYR